MPFTMGLRNAILIAGFAACAIADSDLKWTNCLSADTTLYQLNVGTLAKLNGTLTASDDTVLFFNGIHCGAGDRSDLSVDGSASSAGDEGGDDCWVDGPTALALTSTTEYRDIPLINAIDPSTCKPGDTCFRTLSVYVPNGYSFYANKGKGPVVSSTSPSVKKMHLAQPGNGQWSKKFAKKNMNGYAENGQCYNFDDSRYFMIQADPAGNDPYKSFIKSS